MVSNSKFKVGQSVLVVRTETPTYDYTKHVNTVGIITAVGKDGCEVRHSNGNSVYWWFNEVRIEGELSEALYGE